MTKARKDGRCDYDFIVDRSRPEYTAGGFEDPAAFLDTLQYGYRKNYWQMQAKHVEIFTEKDSVVGSIESQCRELGVSLYPCRGFNSTTKVHEAAARLSRIDKPIVIFYLGDHDPSGRAMDQDIKRRLIYQGAPRFNMKRLAIFPADIVKFDLPPFKSKDGDSRTEEFLLKYNDECVELDALPPTELRRRIQRAVEDEMDIEAWNRAVAVEEVERQSIQDFLGTYS